MKLTHIVCIHLSRLKALTHGCTYHQADCCPLITSYVLIGISVKEMGAVKVAPSGTDMLQHETAGANLVESHMLFYQKVV